MSMLAKDSNMSLSNKKIIVVGGRLGNWLGNGKKPGGRIGSSCHRQPLDGAPREGKEEYR